MTLFFNLSNFCVAKLKIFRPLTLLCQILTAVNVVQTSLFSIERKEENNLKSRFDHPRGLNSTIAGSKGIIANEIDPSNRPSVAVNPSKYVQLKSLSYLLAQQCSNISSSTTPVIQDCTCSTKVLAAQAIKDAVTMVQAVKEVWRDEANLPILYQYMGAPGDG